ncbi:MAG: tyrosine--tRNA ligase [Candidatus Azambacteria bacterium]|nr:tyrosine--tRNA ligase [Candidatus Azambacteria bacterium]
METQKNFYDILKGRGFIEQSTNENSLRQLLSRQKVTFYIGFDPTASSLHIGHLVSLMAMAWLQKQNHQPIFLAGGGTGLVGDPSGKDKARPIISREQVSRNVQAIKKQVSNIIDFNKNRALLLNNADWLTKLNYIEFLRDFGVHFSVNRMLTHEAIKTRLEKGISFLEFNYQLLQAYDFWHLFKYYNCLVQMGGSDQWGNVVAGIELVRRLEKKEAYGITFPLIKTATGKKMGKTEKGTVWLDSQLTSAYDYYQYWINTDDKDVKKLLSIFTFLAMGEINKLARLKGAELRQAKEILAFEATKIVHGQKAAEKARYTSRSLFGKDKEQRKRADLIPAILLRKEELKKGILISKLFVISKLSKSVSEARRLIIQGGGYLDEKRLVDPNLLIKEDNFKGGEMTLRAGKKVYRKIKIR